MYYSESTYNPQSLPPSYVYLQNQAQKQAQKAHECNLSKVALVALFVLGCIAISKGKVCPPKIGWASVGLSGLITIDRTYALYTEPDSISSYFSLFHSIACIVVGSLAAQGHLSGKALGWTILGPTIASVALICCCCCCCACCCAALAPILANAIAPINE